jgi:hypothetical protein
MHKLLHFVLYHSRNQLCLLVATWQRHMTPRVAHNFQPSTFTPTRLTISFLTLTMHKTLPSTQRYLTHYLSHTHITHWDFRHIYCGICNKLNLISTHISFYLSNFSTNLIATMFIYIHHYTSYVSLVGRAPINRRNWNDNIVTLGENS